MLKMTHDLAVTGIPVLLVEQGDEFRAQDVPADVTHAYVLDGQGWHIFRRNFLGESLAKLSKGPAFLGEAKPFFRLQARLPVSLLRVVVSFFKAVYRAYQSEAFVYLYVDPDDPDNERAWSAEVPAQKVSSGKVKYEKPEASRGRLRLAGDMHSHGSMSAFHSGVDDHDEDDFDGIHVTVGHLDGDPTLSCSVVVQGQRFTLEKSDLFDVEPEDTSFPADWMRRVTKDNPLPYGGGHFAWQGESQRQSNGTGKHGKEHARRGSSFKDWETDNERYWENNYHAS